jgi:YD repeat-containing protein
LGNHTSLATAYTTTYTHCPLVGVLTATDPTGLTTTYEYDELGRLLRIKDPAGKVMEEYEYNYAH